jgi:hypothetical protein
MGASQVPVNNPELTLRAMLERAGLHGYEPQRMIDLGRPLGTTTPDFFYAPRNDAYEGLCIYLDGMGRHLHGNPETRDKDRNIREELRNRGYEVIEVQFGQLTDPDAMRHHFFRVGRFLLGKDAAQRIRNDSSWYPAPVSNPNEPSEDTWTEILGLLDSPWHSLAQGLRLENLPPPDEVDWDWIEAGKVSGKRALLMWSTRNGPVVAVDAAAGIAPGPTIVTIEPNSRPADIAALLQALLETRQ